MVKVRKLPGNPMTERQRIVRFLRDLALQLDDLQRADLVEVLVALSGPIEMLRKTAEIWFKSREL